MRKLLAVGMLAAFAMPVSAAQLSLRFVGGDTDADATVQQGSDITVEVLWITNDDDDASNGLNAISFNTTSTSEDPLGGIQGTETPDLDLFMSDNATGLPGWNVTAVPFHIGNGAQYSAFGNTGADSDFSTGTLVVGSFKVSVELTAALGAHTFYIKRDNVVSPTVGNGAGASYAFNNDGDGYEGNFSIGNGYAGNGNGSNSSPMTINVVPVPEPAALALLALGGIAVLRRRS